MNELIHPVDTADEDEPALVQVGDAAALTEGQGGGSSEDKRRAYNC
ncbi:albusnodin family lasso peptide [Kitasatospora sp. NPDC057904]